MEDIRNFGIHAASFANVLDVQHGEQIVGFEVWPVALNRAGDGSTDSEPLTPEDIAAGRVPDVYGVYARVGTSAYNLAQVIADCADEQSAYELVFLLQVAVAYAGGKLDWLVKPFPGSAPIPVIAAEQAQPAPLVIGWCYNKRGDAVPVYAPVNSNLEPVYPSGQTVTGQIAGDVGGGRNKWDFDKLVGAVARPSYKYQGGRAWAATETKTEIKIEVRSVTRTIVSE